MDKHVYARLCTDSYDFYSENVTCRVHLQLLGHLVAAVPTALVVSARGVATVRVIVKSRDTLIHFPSGRCVERHLNYLFLAVKHLVLCAATFPDEDFLKSQTGVLPEIHLLLTLLSNQSK